MWYETLVYLETKLIGEPEKRERFDFSIVRLIQDSEQRGTYVSALRSKRSLQVKCHKWRPTPIVKSLRRRKLDRILQRFF
jgi:hypothetical protein